MPVTNISGIGPSGLPWICFERPSSELALRNVWRKRSAFRFTRRSTRLFSIRIERFQSDATINRIITDFATAPASMNIPKTLMSRCSVCTGALGRGALASSIRRQRRC